MTFETWDNLINHLLVLTATRKFEAQAHTLYVSDMFAELQKYSDEDVSTAARAIVENENLYGNYPPLAVWLKYIPQKRAENNALLEKENKFLDLVEYGFMCDRMYFDATQYKELLEQNGFADIVLRLGGVGAITTLYSQTQFAKEDFMRRARETFKNVMQDKKLSVPTIASQPDLKRIK